MSSHHFSMVYPPHHFQPPTQPWGPTAPRSAMDGKLLIANPNCTTAIAAMALWPSGHPTTIPRIRIEARVDPPTSLGNSPTK